MNLKAAPTLPSTATAVPLRAKTPCNKRAHRVTPGSRFTVALVLILLCARFTCHSQAADDPESLVKKNDSLLFDVGFNRCELSQFENLLSADFIFYHDKAGVTRTKAAFLKDLREKHCAMSYRARRELVPGTLQVFLLHRNDTVYGALQTGTHRFFSVEKGKADKLTSTARFSHTWLFEEDVLKLSHVISYDHREPGDGTKPQNINNRSPRKQ